MRSISRLGAAVCAWVGLQAAALAMVRVEINLDTQRMHVESDTGAHYDWPISSGRPGHATPRGTFRPQAMYSIAFSRKYDNAPMPHAIFFHGPYAIHGTRAIWALGHVASHGCVRLSPAHAARLFALVKREGARIRIVGSVHAESGQGFTQPKRVLGPAIEEVAPSGHSLKLAAQ